MKDWQGNYTSLELKAGDAASCSHQGQCDEDVSSALTFPYIKSQFDALSTDAIRAELKEYGAWDEIELADDVANRSRLLWVAAAAIRDDVQC